MFPQVQAVATAIWAGYSKFLEKCRRIAGFLRAALFTASAYSYLSAMDYKLVVIAGDAKQKIIKIKPPTIIGRSRDADVPVGHALVSRRHCEITVSEDGTLIVEDLGSLNGTYHGDQRITEPVYLEPGDKLTVGSITFQAQYGDFQAETDPPVAKAKATAKDDDDDLPDFLSEDDDDDEEVAEVPDEDDAEEDDAPNFEATIQKPKAPEPVAKKRRPPPPVIESATEDEDIADMLELPEDDEIEEVEDLDDEGDFEVDAESAGEVEGDSQIPVGDDEPEEAGSDSANIEEEVEVAAGDSRSGDSGSGMSWLTGDEDDEEGKGKPGESGLDDFFKSL